MRFLSPKQKWLVLAGVFIAVATLLWFRLSVKEIPLSVVIQYKNLPEALTVVSPAPKVIDVVIRGSKSKIKKIKKSSKTNPMTFDLDLSTAEIGMNAFPVQLENAVFPRGIKVLRTSLSVLVVKVDRKMQKEVPVQAVLAGKPGAGFVIADSAIDPSHVALSGPESIIKTFSAAKTKPIDINGAKESLKTTALLDLPEDVQAVLPDAAFTARIYVEEKWIIRSFDQIPVEGKNCPYPFSVSPAVLDLKLKGPQNILDKLTTGSGLEVYIDLADLQPGVFDRPATIRTPVGMVLVYVKPEIFTVTVTDGKRLPGP